MLVRGWKNGQKFFDRVKYSPTLYTETQRESEFKSLEGRNVEPTTFETMSACKEFLLKYEGTHNFNLFGMDNHTIGFISEAFPGKIEYDANQIDIGSLDIEVESEFGFPDIDSANERINAITIHLKDQYITFGLGAYVPHLPNVKYFQFDDERDMLLAFLSVWENLKLDVVTGWYVAGFDIPYLVRRINRVVGNNASKRLSPWGLINERKFQTKRGEQIEYELVGINVIDLLDTYKKFSNQKLESYKLDFVAYHELKKNKTDISEYGSLKTLYKNNFQLFIEYNIRDTKLVSDINNKTRLIELVMRLAYDAKINMPEVFMSTRIWDSKIYNSLKERKIIIPYERSKEVKSNAFAGAFVAEPKPGLYPWVITLDVKSMYPSLIMQYNISTETLVGQLNVNLDDLVAGKDHGHLQYLKDNNLSMAANGTVYRKDIRGFCPRMIDDLMEERDGFKKLMLDTQRQLVGVVDPVIKAKLEADEMTYDILQQTRKVNLNSLYGALGSEGFRYFMVQMAEAVTISGQHVILWAWRHLNEYMNKICGTEGVEYVIYADTDSISLHVENLVNRLPEGLTDQQITDIIIQFAKTKIQPFLAGIFERLAESMNAYDQKIFMKIEKTAKTGVYVKSKRYMLNVIDKEGVRYDTPQVSVTGLESVRSSTPEKVRGYLKETFKVLMTGSRDTTLNHIDAVKKEYNSLPIHDIASPTSVNEVTKYSDRSTIYKKGSAGRTPMNSRGAILYNHHIQKLGLTNKYEFIKDSDKVKVIYLKMPNPIFENAIAFTNDVLPPEFGVHGFIDYERQFEKDFLNPLKTVFEAIGWDISNQVDLSDVPWL